MKTASLRALVAVLVLVWAAGCTPPSLPTPAAEGPAPVSAATLACDLARFAPHDPVTTYTDTEVGLALDVPAGWHVEATPGSLAIITSYDPGEAPGIGGVPPDKAKVDLAVDPLAQSVSLEELVADVHNQARQPELDILWEERWELTGGVPALRMQVVGAAGGEMALLLAVINGRSLRLQGYGDLSYFDAIACTLRPISPSETAPAEPGVLDFTSSTFGVALQHPAGWQPVAGYDERYGGADGFFQLAAFSGEGWTLDEVCDLEAHHKLQPYGSSPAVERLPGFGQDGCLILPSADQPADMQGQAALIVPYPQPVPIGGDCYLYFILRADQNHIRPIAWTFRFVLPPGGAAEEPALVWEAQQDDGTCQSMHLTPEGWPTIGPCGEPTISPPYFGYRQYLGFWPDWLARFASFEAETPSGRVVFQGQGEDEAPPAWQRALGDWARLVWMELQFGRSGASWGAALAGHWQTSGRSGYCQFLQVETYGYAYASIARCGGGDAHDLGRGWLETAEWLPFDAWLQGRAAVYRQDLDFFGSGSQAMSDDEQDALSRWAESVYSRLTRGHAR
ncbi:MAG: hypothetical protein H8D78_13835 [Chloroflexi bacterium]|nr:hypothetical protein [Chloroflexota bacterium]